MKTKYTFVLNNNSKIVLTEEGEPKLSQDDIDKIMNSKNIIVVSTATDSLKIRPSQISAIHVTIINSNKKNNKEEFLSNDEEEIQYELDTKDTLYDDETVEDLDEDTNVIIESDDISNDDIELLSSIDFSEDDDMDSILNTEEDSDVPIS